MNIRRELEEKLSAALAAAGAEAGSPAMVAPAARPEFGDYQANGAMAAAKKLRANPRQLAEKFAAAARAALGDMAASVDVAGPGFINIRLADSWLAERLGRAAADERLGAVPAAEPQTVVVDYSAPNIAKEMHVGHLRSTIIGDALALTLDFLGHKVIRQNHVGDWGTQFGSVILGLWHICQSEQHGHYTTEYAHTLMECKQNGGDTGEILRHIRDLHNKYWEEDRDTKPGDGNRYFGPFLMKFANGESGLSFENLLPAYQFVNQVEKLAEGTGLTIRTRKKNQAGEFETVEIPYSSLSSHIAAMLQNIGDPDNKQEKQAWEEARRLSLEHCERVYASLGVTLTRGDVRGESFFGGVNPDNTNYLPGIIADLQSKLGPMGYFRESQGAQCVFLPEFKGKDGEELPLIVQKSDEGYLYATTDLAAIRYRVIERHADRILYVVDARQSLHFDMVFATARTAGFVPPEVSLKHIAFGTMMGADGKPFKTRTGGTVKLMDLLNEAEERAYNFVSEKSPELPETERLKIAHRVGIGAVKYADLSQNRTSDYVFSWDKMLSLDGNTAPYMQYAYARIRSIFRKADEREKRGQAPFSNGNSENGDRPHFSGEPIRLTEPAERTLAMKLARFPETVEMVAAECLPNVLCAYLYELAGAFMGFYESCPVLKAEPAIRASRLELCDLAARIIHKGLELLGIQTLEQM